MFPCFKPPLCPAICSFTIEPLLLQTWISRNIFFFRFRMTKHRKKLYFTLFFIVTVHILVGLSEGFCPIGSFPVCQGWRNKGARGAHAPPNFSDQLTLSQTRGAGYTPHIFSPGATPVCIVHFANARHRLHLNLVVLNLVRCKALRSCKNERKKN